MIGESELSHFSQNRKLLEQEKEIWKRCIIICKNFSLFRKTIVAISNLPLATLLPLFPGVKFPTMFGSGTQQIGQTFGNTEL